MPAARSAVATCRPPIQNWTVPVGVTPWAPVTVAVTVVVSFFFWTRSARRRSVTVESCRVNGTLRPTSSGLWSEARNWFGW